MNRFLKLTIEPLFCNTPGGLVDETANLACVSIGSCGSGEYLFNIDALDFFPATINDEGNPYDQYAKDSRIPPIMTLNAGATLDQGQDFYNSIILQFATKIVEEGECQVSINELFGYQALEEAIDVINGGSPYGDITTVEQAYDAVFAAHRIWADALQTIQANTKLAIEVSGNIFKGKVYSVDGLEMHLVGWEFVHTKN